MSQQQQQQQKDLERKQQKLSFHELQQHSCRRTEARTGSLEHVLGRLRHVSYQISEVSLEGELQQDLEDQEEHEQKDGLRAWTQEVAELKVALDSFGLVTLLAFLVGLDHVHHLGKNATEQLSSWVSRARHSSAWIMTTTRGRTQRNNLVLGCQGSVRVRPGECYNNHHHHHNNNSNNNNVSSVSSMGNATTMCRWCRA